MCKCKQVAMITLTWNANKVIWHLPNLTCKFISCTAILFYTYIVYKTGCPFLALSSWSPFLLATITWLHDFLHWYD